MLLIAIIIILGGVYMSDQEIQEWVAMLEKEKRILVLAAAVCLLSYEKERQNACAGTSAHMVKQKRR